MNSLDTTQQELIAALSTGEWISGSTLAQRLALSREAVSKRVQKLAGLGLRIEAQSGRGYKLEAPLDLLDARGIAGQLIQPCPVTVLPSVDSTNRWAAAQDAAPCLCLTEHQSLGRGRRGRHWHSPYGQNLYLSLRWTLPHWPEKLPALSLALGVALAQTLRELAVPAQLKWPNDLYLGGRKFGGMLIEQAGEAGGPCTLVIGLGLNVAMRDAQAIDQSWTSLALQGYPVERNALAIALCNCLLTEMTQFSSARLTARLQEFSRFDLFHGQQVKLLDGDELIHGQALGLDEWGRLRLRCESGIRHFSVGDLSLRGA